MLRKSLFSFLLSSIITVSAWATPLELAKAPTFVDPASITLEVIPPPPAAGSLQQARDLTILMWEQNRRTMYDAQRAWGSVTLEPSYFNEALNARFEEARYPKLYNLMKAVLGDAKIFTDALKLHYKVARPYDADPTMQPIIPVEESFTYPSGHAARGMTSALVLAELFPARRDELLQVGLTLGQDRVIGGVHYVSDIESSVILSQALAQSIIASDAFKAQVLAAQDEINAIQAMQTQP